jgi:hypothetical protein
MQFYRLNYSLNTISVLKIKDMRMILHTLVKIVPAEIFLRYILIFLTLPGLSTITHSQEIADLSATSGKWIYTNYNLSNEWFGERFYRMNAAELDKFHKTTEKIVNYMEQQPVAQKPLGVTLNAQSRTAYYQYDHNKFPVKMEERVKAELFIPFCSLIQKGGKVEYNCNEVSYVDVVTNDEYQVYESAMSYDQLDDHNALHQFKELFFLPHKLLDLGDGIYLFDGYYKNRVVISRRDRQLWLPVTNSEYTNRMVIYYTASLREGKIPQMVMDALKSEIGAIPPELMTQPAFLSSSSGRPLTSICGSDVESASALYKLNPGYFDPSLPRTHVQLITITMEGNADNPEWGGINAKRVWELIQGMKGSDLRKLLDVN